MKTNLRKPSANRRMKRTTIFFLLPLFLILSYLPLKAQTLPSDVLAKLNSYNVSWDSSSTTGSGASMPLGNGDITANVWVEKGGDLMMYIGKSDTWSEATRLLKIGRLRMNFSPNPFVAGQPFNQTLNLYKGEIDITAGNTGNKVNIKVWIDANNGVIHVEASGDHNFVMDCKNELMRPTPYTFNTNAPVDASVRGVNGINGLTESADVKISKSTGIEWYHRNSTSPYQTILNTENLSSLSANYPDPYLNRTFGAFVKGSNFTVKNDAELQSSSGNNFALSVYAYTAQTSTATLWDSQLASQVTQIDQTAMATAYTNHGTWWDTFWNRSWIFVSGDADAVKVTRGYLLQRFMEACQGRGQYPIKFNGGSLTFDYQGQNGDYRAWGPAYWNQNTRHLYWPLLGSGDYDLLMPWFNQYMNMLGIQQAATNKYYNHGGAFFPETYNMFGLYIADDWGWGNTSTTASNQYIRYHYQGALETLSQMLDYYDYTKDASFVTNYIAPYSAQVIRFFDQHWPRVNGKIKFDPANAIETYWGCTNPTDYIAGLRYTIPRLVALNSPAITSALKTEWTNCLNALPPIPMNSDNTAVLPAEIYGQANNLENPECYAIFPYKIYGVGKPNMNVGITTFTNRKFKFGHCWGQDAMQAALLKLTDVAKAGVIEEANETNPAARFPAFWGPASDYIPDLDNGGALMMSLQNMVMQNANDSIYVLPSWPSTWSVDYKLQSPNNTNVRVVSNGTNISQLTVVPSSRSSYVVLPDGKQSQTMTMPPVSVTWVGDADANPYAVASSGLSVSYSSSNTSVATIVNGKIHAVGAGTCTITATQAGNGSYNVAVPATQQLTVLSRTSTATTIQAESWSGQSGVQTETTGDLNGNLDVAYIDNGDYTFYNNVNFGTGAATMEMRVASYASVPSVGSIEVRSGSPTGTLLGTLSVPGTNGWQNWITVPCNLTGATGVQNIYLVFRNGGFNLNWIYFDNSPVTNTPYTGTPINIPGTIEAENYDNGGEGIAYHDNDAVNSGGQQRTNQGVDVENASDATGTYDVGFTNPGEWMKYTVNVTTAGAYTLQVRAAAPSAGATIHVELDGTNISGTISIPATGGWQTYQTVSVTTSSLSAGQHVLRIYEETGGFNINYITFTSIAPAPVISSAATATGTTGTAFTYNITASNNPTSYNATGLPAGLTVNTTTGAITGTPTTAGTYTATVSATNTGGTGSKQVTITISNPATNTPYLGTPWAIPGTIEAENYDDGGEGVAYHDNDAINSGGQQRTTQGVDVENAGDATGTYDVGFTNPGEWMKYTVNVTTAGTYTLQARVASPGTGNSFHVELDGTTIGTIAIPTTTGWQTYQTVSVTTPSLSAGQHVLRIYEETGGFNINYITFAAIAPAPVISSAATATGTTGTAFTYNITASNNPTSYNATGLPAGLTVNTTTGAITGTPTTAGTYNTTVSATNSNGTGSKTVTITVTQPAPVISSATTATGTTGAAFSYQIVASNSPTSFGASGLPAGISVNTTTGLISGTPTTAGTYNATVTATNSAGSGNQAVTITISTAASNTPYGGVAWQIPGTIEVENYDDGGEGIAYHDNDAINSGGQQRTNQGVDVENVGDVIGTYDVGWTNAGEWMKYTVNVTTTNTYTLQLRAASPGGGSIHVELDGTNISGIISIPATGGWQTYQTVSVTTPSLSAGLHVLRIYEETGGFNLNYITFSSATTSQPSITSATTANATLGTAFTYNITASNSPTSYGATGLPSGLSVNTSTGAISGTAVNSGTYSVTISATNAAGTGSATLSLTVSAATDPSGVITCYKAPGTITVDGNLTETGWNIAKPFSKIVYGTPNNTANFGVLWDNSNLYIGVKMLDANLFADSPNLWDDDAIEVYIDANYNKLTSYDGMDNQIIKGYNNSGVFTKFTLSGLQHAWGTISGGYTIELAVPWSQLGISAPAAGTNIGFDISYDDDDNGGTREGQAVWNGTIDNWQNTSGFGRLTLNAGISSMRIASGDEPAVENNTVDLYPNPVTDGILTIAVPVEWTNESSVTIWNALGAPVFSSVEVISNHQYELELQNLTSGVYFIQIMNNGKMITKSFIIQ
ncbi:MAG TPA: carbohydrate-binding protein [Cytophagaceae bacterium]|nr:carbohydrate-binding protein [Cytophagaceae bacterium]